MLDRQYIPVFGVNQGLDTNIVYGYREQEQQFFAVFPLSKQEDHTGEE